MKKLILSLLIFCTLAAAGQSWTPIAGKQRFGTGLGIPVRDSGFFSSGADTALIYINKSDTTSLYWRYKGAHQKVGGGGSTDTTSLSNRINLKLNISDTAGMLSPYARDFNVVHKTGNETVYGEKTFQSALTTLHDNASGTGQLFFETATSGNIGRIAYTSGGLFMRAGANNYLSLGSNDSNDRLRIHPSGNINVGGSIDSSAYRLQVTGSSLLSGVAKYATNYGSFFDSRSLVNKGYVDSANALRTSGSGTTNYIPKWTSTTDLGNSQIFDNGTNVGIGTTSPSNRFVVSNAGASGFEINPTGGVNSGVLLQAYNRTTSAYVHQSYYATAHTFNVGTAAATRALDITSAGNALIGTTTDNGTDRLQVNGSGLYTGGLTVGTSSGSIRVGTTGTGADGVGLLNSYNYSFAEGSGASYANVFRQSSSAATVIGNGYKYTATAGGFASSIGVPWAKSAIAVGAAGGGIAFYTNEITTVANGTDITPTERMRILPNGNIGVNNNNPFGSFVLDKNVNDVHGFSIRNLNSGSNATSTLSITNDTQLGLEVNVAPSGATGTYWGLNNSNLVSTQVKNFNSNWIFNLANSNGVMAFGLNSNEAYRINQSRRILVNTTTDNGTDRLQVNGSIQGTGFDQAYTARTTAYTATDTDYLIDCTSGTFTVTLPAASGRTGRILIIKNSGTGTITVDGNASETIDGATTYSLSAQWATVQIMCDGTNWKIISKF